MVATFVDVLANIGFQIVEQIAVFSVACAKHLMSELHNTLDIPLCESDVIQLNVLRKIDSIL